MGRTEAQRPGWAPSGVDLDRPNPARMYDYYLGGSHNFAADRALARQVVAAWPEAPLAAQANRAYLRRAVAFMVGQGIRQLLDIGSGIPTVGNVHEVARRERPDTRVVYVDTDPIAVAHSRAILAGDEHTAVVQADGRAPDRLLAEPDLRRTIDFDQPVGLLMVAFLHFVPDDQDPLGILEQYRAALAPGSYLAISHGTKDGRSELATLEDMYQRSAIPVQLRSRLEVERLLGGFDLVEPGVVFLPEWRPGYPEDVDEHPEWSSGYAGVGLRR